MNEKGKTSERERRDWIIFLIILLIGFLCVIVAGEQAARFSPRWSLDSNMRSNLDPNSDFLTNRPDNFYEPLDPSILTQQIRINNFLTPGALFEIHTLPPALGVTNTPLGTSTTAPTQLTSPTAFNNTNTPSAATPSPTNTVIYYPPPPSTNTPKPPPTNTPVTPLPTADLAITKNDGGLTAVDPNDTVIYTVRVTNNGPDSVTGAILSVPSATGLSKTLVTCSPPAPGQQCVTPPTITDLEGGSFALPPLNSGEFYEIAITTDVTATSGSVTNSATVTAPAGVIDPTGNNSASDTNTVNLVADLQITKDDGATAYEVDGSTTYTIIVSNTGPSDVTGARVQDTFTMAVDSINWTCTPSNISAACENSSGSGDIDELVNLPALTSVTYLVTVDIAAGQTANLTNTATVTPPSGVTDPTMPNIASDPAPDVLIVSSSLPFSDIGEDRDNKVYVVPAGTNLTLAFSTSLVVNAVDSDGWDLVMYEMPNGSGIAMDVIQLQLGNGSNWYTIFYWGDGSADTNSNLNTDVIGLAENDNRDFTTVPASDILYPFGSGSPPPPPSNAATGVVFQLDGIIPAGSYSYIRIISPLAGDADGGCEIDGFSFLP